MVGVTVRVCLAGGFYNRVLKMNPVCGYFEVQYRWWPLDVSLKRLGSYWLLSTISLEILSQKWIDFIWTSRISVQSTLLHWQQHFQANTRLWHIWLSLTPLMPPELDIWRSCLLNETYFFPDRQLNCSLLSLLMLLLVMLLTHHPLCFCWSTFLSRYDQFWHQNQRRTNKPHERCRFSLKSAISSLHSEFMKY